MSAALVLAVVLAVAIPWQLVAAYRFDDGLVDRWARDHGLELVLESRPIVRRFLRRERLFRTWGGVAGAVMPSAIEFASTGRIQVLGFGTDGESAPLAFGSIFLGYLLGALCAEVSLVRPVPPARRRAGLTRRELESYLPHTLVLAQRALAGVAAVGSIAVGLVPFPDPVSNPGLPELALIAAVVLAGGVGLEAVERWLVRRPQPFISPALVAADDAIRAQSLRSVAGAALALVLLYCCGLAMVLQASEVAAFHSTMLVLAAVFLVASLVACRDIGESRWRAPRAGTPVSA